MPLRSVQDAAIERFSGEAVIALGDHDQALAGGEQVARPDEHRDQQRHGNGCQCTEYSDEIGDDQFAAMGEDHRHELVPAIG